MRPSATGGIDHVGRPALVAMATAAIGECSRAAGPAVELKQFVALDNIR
jgi:hypothetical protein